MSSGSPAVLVALGMLWRKPGPTFSPSYFLTTVLPPSGHGDSLSSASALFTCSSVPVSGLMMAQEPGRVLLSLSALCLTDLLSVFEPPYCHLSPHFVLTVSCISLSFDQLGFFLKCTVGQVFSGPRLSPALHCPQDKVQTPEHGVRGSWVPTSFITHTLWAPASCRQRPWL